MSIRVYDLDATQIEQYRERCKKINGFTNFMHEYFDLEIDICKGYSKDEIAELLEKTSEPYKKALLSELRPRGDGRVLMRQANSVTWTTKQYQSTFGGIVKCSDNKYNIIIVHACQTRDIDKNKVLGAGLMALGGSLMEGFGVGQTEILLGLQKLGYDLQQDMPNVVAGYVADQMVNKRMLKIENSEFFLTL